MEIERLRAVEYRIVFIKKTSPGTDLDMTMSDIQADFVNGASRSKQTNVIAKIIRVIVEYKNRQRVVKYFSTSTP